MSSFYESLHISLMSILGYLYNEVFIYMLFLGISFCLLSTCTRQKKVIKRQNPQAFDKWKRSEKMSSSNQGRSSVSSSFKHRPVNIGRIRRPIQLTVPPVDDSVRESDIAESDQSGKPETTSMSERGKSKKPFRVEDKQGTQPTKGFESKKMSERKVKPTRKNDKKHPPVVENPTQEQSGQSYVEEETDLRTPSFVRKAYTFPNRYEKLPPASSNNQPSSPKYCARCKALLESKHRSPEMVALINLMSDHKMKRTLADTSNSQKF